MFKALNDYVILKHKQIKETKAGIIIPDTVRTVDETCDVVDVGQTCKVVKKKDTVICNLNACQAFTYKKEIYLITREANIYVILTDGDDNGITLN